MGHDACATVESPQEVDVTQTRCQISRWPCDDEDAAQAFDTLIEEVPIALVYNGISHAVMLATPADIEDFAIGFSLSEGIIGSMGEVRDIEVLPRDEGIEVQLTIATKRMAALTQRRRALAGRTGCGLCGIESLAQLARSIPRVAEGGWLSTAVLDATLDDLFTRQTLHRITGAAHAATFVQWSGTRSIVREDVGRHNALDKVIGAMAQDRIDAAEGFALITSRASYEMVLKCATSGIRLLAALSAPTALAQRTAEAAGITLVGFASRSRRTVYAHSERVHSPRSGPDGILDASISCNNC